MVASCGFVHPTASRGCCSPPDPALAESTCFGWKGMGARHPWKPNTLNLPSSGRPTRALARRWFAPDGRLPLDLLPRSVGRSASTHAKSVITAKATNAKCSHCHRRHLCRALWSRRAVALRPVPGGSKTAFRRLFWQHGNIRGPCTRNCIACRLSPYITFDGSFSRLRMATP